MFARWAWAVSYANEATVQPQRLQHGHVVGSEHVVACSLCLKIAVKHVVARSLCLKIAVKHVVVIATATYGKRVSF